MLKPRRSDFAIETVELTKRFKKAKSYRDILLRPFARQEITALQDVSLGVKAGEILGLLGPNGAGKTTLIKILSTLVLPTAGETFVAGYDVVQNPREVKKRIGSVVTEERSFFWRLTGRQNLRFFATLNNIPEAVLRQKTDEAISLVGLERVADKVFRNYSTGMKHRLAIARALLTEPEVLFLDEPTKSLDPTSAEAMRCLICDLAAGPPVRTILFATHDLQEVERVAHRIVILDRGRIKARGTAAELRRSVRQKRRFALRLRRPSEQVTQLLRRQAASVTETEARAGEDTQFLIESDDSQTVSSLVRELVLAGAEVVECVALEPSLSEVFAFVTQGKT